MAWESGTRSVSRACWATVSRASQNRAPWSRGSRHSHGSPGLVVDGGRCGAGQREQGGFEQGAVLGRAAAADPDSSGAVVADREVAVEVGGAFLTVQGGFEPAVHGVGVDDLDEVPAGPGEVGGVQGPGLAEQDLLPAASGPVTGPGGPPRTGR